MFVGAAVGLLASIILPMGQKSWAHRKEVGQSTTYFKMDAALDKTRHEEKLLQASSHYKLQHTSTLQHYSEAMAVAVDLARRETVRDVWVQRSLLNQTIMFNGALMLSCVFENFSQSALPRVDGAPMSVWVLYVLNASLGMALFLCTVCIVLCLKIQDRLGWYALGDPQMVYHCGKAHATFNDYFDCHCETVRSAADGIFYAAGGLTIVASIVLQCVKFSSSHKDDADALVAIHVIFSGLGIALLPLLIHFFGVGRWGSTGAATTIDFGGLGAATADEQQQQQQLQRQREKQRAEKMQQQQHMKYNSQQHDDDDDVNRQPSPNEETMQRVPSDRDRLQGLPPSVGVHRRNVLFAMDTETTKK